MGFFKVITGNLVKWWQLVVMPVLRINNDRFFQTNQQENLHVNTNNMQGGVSQSQAVEPSKSLLEQQSTASMSANVTRTKKAESGVAQTGDKQAGDDAMAVLERINREKEEKRLQEIEQARRKNEEEARIASIMNANKVDVNAFIQAGKDSVSERQNQDAEQARKDEEMRRAQEILDRLQRESAEDEAKKLAEIEKAKKQAEEQFGR